MEATGSVHGEDLALALDAADWHLQEAKRLLGEAAHRSRPPSAFPENAAIPRGDGTGAGTVASKQDASNRETELLEDAIAHLRRGITLKPRGAEMFVAAAEAYGALLDSASAVAHLRYAVNVLGTDDRNAKKALAQRLYDRGRIWLEAGDAASAIEDLHEASQLYPSDPKAFFLLACAYTLSASGEPYEEHAHNASSSGGGTNNNNASSRGASSWAAAFAAADTAANLVLAWAARSHDDWYVRNHENLSDFAGAPILVLRGKLNWQRGQVDAGNRDFRAAQRAAPQHPEVLAFQRTMAAKASAFYASAKAAMMEPKGKDNITSAMTSTTTETAALKTSAQGAHVAHESEQFGSSSDGRDLAAAVRYLTSALRMTPEDVKLYVLRASALRQGGFFQDALRDLDACAERCFAAHFNLRLPEDDSGYTGDNGGGAGSGGGAVGGRGGSRGSKRRDTDHIPSDEASLSVADQRLALRRALAEATKAYDELSLGIHNESNAVTTTAASADPATAVPIISTGPWIEPWEVARQRHLCWNDAALLLMLRGDHAAALPHLNRAVDAEARMYRSSSANASSNGNANFFSPPSTQGLSPRVQDASRNKVATAGVAPAPGDAATVVDARGIDVRFLVNRGECLRCLGDLVGAKADLTAALEADPTHWDTRTRLSVVRYTLGVEAFNASTSVRPRDAPALLASAEEELTAAVELNPKVATYYAARGHLRYAVHNFSGAHADFKAALELDPSLVELASRLGQFEPTHDTTRATHPDAVAWEASQHQRQNQQQLLVSASQPQQQQQQRRSKRGSGRPAAHAPPALLGYDPSQGPAPRGLLTSPTVAAVQQQQQQRCRNPLQQPKTFTQAHRLKPSADEAPFLPHNSATQRPTVMLPAIQGAEQTSAQVRWIRHEPTPSAQDTKLWKHLKSGAQGNLSTADGRASRARKSNDDGKVKFLWGSTMRIQKLEDQKRAEAAELRRRIASSR